MPKSIVAMVYSVISVYGGIVEDVATYSHLDDAKEAYRITANHMFEKKFTTYTGAVRWIQKNAHDDDVYLYENIIRPKGGKLP